MMLRALTAVVFVGLFGLPIVLPLAELRTAGPWESWREVDRVAELALATLGLCGLTLVISFPPGVVLAVLLYRTDLPEIGRHTSELQSLRHLVCRLLLEKNNKS